MLRYQEIRQCLLTKGRYNQSRWRQKSFRTSATLDDDTISSYLEALRKIFVVEDMPAWNPNLRSKTAIRTADTRYFVDPSIATAALGLGPEDLMNDLKTMGFFFETMCVRDLRVFAEALNGNVYHYRILFQTSPYEKSSKACPRQSLLDFPFRTL